MAADAAPVDEEGAAAADTSGKERSRRGGGSQVGGAMRTVSGLELDTVSVCGLEMRMLRRRSDFFAACAGDLPIKSTGLVLWECGPLLADYVGYARWKRTEQGSAAPWWQLHPPCPIVPSRFWPGHRILELGCGCGLVAAVLSSFGAHVLATDCDAATLETAQLNAREAERRAACREAVGTQAPGKAEFAALTWGDAEAAKALVRERGPFHYIVGSDLLYGDKSPPEPLVETLEALFSEPGCADAEAIFAFKNRCADETGVFCRTAQERGLWDICHADPDDILEGYDGPSGYGGDGPAYGVMRLLPRKKVPIACNGAAGPPAEPAPGQAAADVPDSSTPAVPLGEEAAAGSKAEGEARPTKRPRTEEPAAAPVAAPAGGCP